jgi:hypothetical protein
VLLHPREKRPTPQLCTDAAFSGACACLGLVSVVAAKALPRPIAPADCAQIVIGSIWRRPAGADALIRASHNMGLQARKRCAAGKWTCLLTTMRFPLPTRAI